MYKIDKKDLLAELKDLTERMTDYNDPSPDETYSRMESAIIEASSELERMYKTNTEQLKEEVRTKLLECINKLDE